MVERYLLRDCGLAILLAVSACDQGRPTTLAEDKAHAPISGAPPLTLPRRSRMSRDAPSSLATPSITDEQVMAERSVVLEPCLNTGQAADGVSAAIFRCLRAELDFQDGRLNAAYQTAIAARSTTSQAALRAQERDWMRLRDEKCAAQVTGGTIDRINMPDCLIDETIRRRLILEAGQG